MKLTDHISRFLIIMLPIVTEIGCAADRAESTQRDTIPSITSVEQFNSIIENGGDKLLVFNLYADWCMPCHVLAPTLSEVAHEKRTKIAIYKVDTDQFPQITAAFGVTGIPFVVFVKNKKALYALIGVQPKDSYIRIIDAYADSLDEQAPKQKGRKVEGTQINSNGASPFLNYLIPSNDEMMILPQKDFQYPIHSITSSFVHYNQFYIHKNRYI